MARYYFGQTDVLGRNFRIDQSDFPQDLTIVGVVRNTKYKNIREDATRIVYLPYLQFPKPVGEANIAVRTIQNPLDVDELLRKEAQAENPRVQFRGVTTQAQLVNGTIAQDRMLAQLSGFFGFAAAVLVCLGLYGITTYEAGRRTAEIGIRIALGAKSKDVTRLVIGRSLVLVAGGIAAGLGIAFPIEPIGRGPSLWSAPGGYRHADFRRRYVVPHNGSRRVLARLPCLNAGSYEIVQFGVN